MSDAVITRINVDIVEVEAQPKQVSRVRLRVSFWDMRGEKPREVSYAVTSLLPTGGGLIMPLNEDDPNWDMGKESPGHYLWAGINSIDLREGEEDE